MNCVLVLKPCVNLNRFAAQNILASCTSRTFKLLFAWTFFTKNSVKGPGTIKDLFKCKNSLLLQILFDNQILRFAAKFDLNEFPINLFKFVTPVFFKIKSPDKILCFQAHLFCFEILISVFILLINIFLGSICKFNISQKL
jgi:hypothetical protein